MNINEVFRVQDLPKDKILERVEEYIEKFESGETVKVPNVHHRNAEFNGARWIMPKKYVKWSKNGDCGKRLLKELKALRKYLKTDEIKRQRDNWYDLIHNYGVFQQDGRLKHPGRTLKRTYIPRIEALIGTEREKLNILGKGRGYLWSPRGHMSTGKRKDVDLSVAPAIRSDIRRATLTGVPPVVISVEKPGEQESLEDSGLAEVLDFMVVTPRGRTNREALRFLKKMKESGRRVFTLNDGDIAGLSMPLEMMGLSRSSAHLGDDFRPEVEHLGVYGRALDHAGIFGISESSSKQKEDAFAKARHLEKDKILAELEHIEETGNCWKTSALDPYDEGLATYLIEAFRAFGAYDDKLFDPEEISSKTVRDKVPDLVWEKVKDHDEIDGGRLTSSTLCKREEETDGYRTKIHHSPGAEAKDKIDDWIEDKAEDFLDAEGPELPDEDEVREETENVLSTLTDELFRNIAVEKYNKDPLNVSPTNDSVAENIKDKMLEIEKTVEGEAEYEIDSHETANGDLKVEITVKEPEFTAEIEDPEIEEVEDPEPGEVTTPYDYAHNELDTDPDFANKLRTGLEKVVGTT